MVKKVGGGSRPPNLPSAGPVAGGKPVQGAKLTGVTQVTGIEKPATAKAARKATRTMTVDEREEIFRLIREEADRMLDSGEIPQGKRKTVESAVRMAVDAAIVDEDGTKK
jgi:hypothetical protein